MDIRLVNGVTVLLVAMLDLFIRYPLLSALFGGHRVTVLGLTLEASFNGTERSLPRSSKSSA